MINLINEMTVETGVYFAIITVINLVLFGFLLANLIKIVRQINNNTFNFRDKFDDKLDQENINSALIGFSIVILIAELYPHVDVKFELIKFAILIVFLVICFIPLAISCAITNAYEHEIDGYKYGKVNKKKIRISLILDTIYLSLLILVISSCYLLI